jgi:hypothetical protein
MEDLVINDEPSTGMPLWLRPYVTAPEKVRRHHRFFSTGVVFSKTGAVPDFTFPEYHSL